MKKETKIIAAVASTTAIAGATVAVGITAIKLLTDMAIDKELPKAANKARSKVNGAIIGEAEFEIGNELARELENREHQTVEIASRDGLKLMGHYFPAANEKRIVIAMHGWRSRWCFDFAGAIDFFLEEGCSMLLVEQRSHGQSEGEFIGFGVYERYDCLDWIEYVKERYPDKGIYLCGISMGATSVLMAAGLTLPECVRGVIADCGFTSPRAIWTHVMKNNLKMSDKLAYPIANFFVSKKAGYEGDEASTVEAMKNCSVPVLFIHGDADTFVPHSMTLEAYDACTSDKTLLIVKGAGHGTSYFYDTEGYQSHVREFFNKNDQ